MVDRFRGFAFARTSMRRFAVNARERSSRALCRLAKVSCGAAMLRVAASHQFASA
jgi:hypothetical protein